MAFRSKAQNAERSGLLLDGDVPNDDPLELSSIDGEDGFLIRSSTTRPRPPSVVTTAIRLVRRLQRSPVYRKLRIVKYFALALATLVILTYLFYPSYSSPPPHYTELAEAVQASREPGRGNPHQEQVFIAVALYDKGGGLAGGRWGQQLLELVDLLGPSNTFVSIYENDSGAEGERALRALEAQLPCASSIVYEEVDKADFEQTKMPDGEERLKRIMYLSELRNRSLRPLDVAGNVTFDRVLFLNDVYFNTVDALHLLFSTNLGPDGRAHYVAACGIDFFFNPFKFYDLYATRDADGYEMGWPYYPFFSNDGSGASRADMLAQKDAVRVKSCWSGIAAMDAQYLQVSSTASAAARPVPAHEHINGANIDPAHPMPLLAPVRFRAEPEIYYDACECCLLMADATELAGGATAGVYWNPYVRVTYWEPQLWKLGYVRRVERLFAVPQYVVNFLGAWTSNNAYRTVAPGQPFREEVWQASDNSAADPRGHWALLDRTGRAGLFCGQRSMQVIRRNGRTWESNWESVPIPGGRALF